MADQEKSNPSTATGPTTTTTAQQGTATGINGEPPPQQNPLGSMLPMLAAMGIFFWLFIMRPESKRRKQKEALMASIKPKDKVVTIFGLYGTVVEIEGDDIVLNVDTKKDVKMRFRRSAIDSVLVEDEKK